MGLEQHNSPGQQPSWAPDGKSFALLYRQRPALYDLQQQRRTPLALDRSYDIAFSPSGTALLYCQKNDDGFSLRRFDLESSSQTVLLSSPHRIQTPSSSPSGSHIFFSWSLHGQQDVFALETASGKLVRVTSHPGNDENPVWDALRQRLIFTSDRGRGLQFGTLFSIPVTGNVQ